MGFDLNGLLNARRGEGSELHARHMNHQVPRVLHAIVVVMTGIIRFLHC